MRFIVTMLIVLAGPVQAQSQRFTIYGAGTLGCGEVIATIEEERRAARRMTVGLAQLRDYLTGVMSGANWAANREMFPPRDLPSRMLFIEEHCRSNPLDDFHRAIVALAAAERRR